MSVKEVWGFYGTQGTIIVIVIVNGTSPRFLLLLPAIQLLSREAKDYAALS